MDAFLGICGFDFPQYFTKAILLGAFQENSFLLNDDTSEDVKINFDVSKGLIFYNAITIIQKEAIYQQKNTFFKKITSLVPRL